MLFRVMIGTQAAHSVALSYLENLRQCFKIKCCFKFVICTVSRTILDF